MEIDFALLYQPAALESLQQGSHYAWLLPNFTDFQMPQAPKNDDDSMCKGIWKTAQEIILINSTWLVMCVHAGQINIIDGIT